MGRISILLVLVAASFFASIPVLADSGEDDLRIGLLASNAGTLASRNVRYCLMPASMPIRPGNDVYLQDDEGRQLRAVTFFDTVALTADIGRFQPSDPCELMAAIPSVPPRDGFRIVIKPDPVPTDLSSTSRVNIAVLVMAYGPFDWWYDERGEKLCRLLGSVPLGEDSPVVTSPASRLQAGPDPERIRFVSGVEYDAEQDEEYCALVAPLEFPIADEYIIEFGGEREDAE